MEQSNEEAEVSIARRLIAQIETAEPDATSISEKKAIPLSDREGEISLEEETEPIGAAEVLLTDAAPGTALSTTFAKVEKSLAALGFFTPASRRVKDQKSKRISFTRMVDDKRVEASAEIIPSAKFGLPVTADQDKYLALQMIITRILETEGKVSNPIKFRSADLIRLLNKNTKAGKNYKEVGEWLDVMATTTIFSEGAVWISGAKRFAKDRFHVFDRAVTVGNELEDGTIADANYVWLSAWQLENINNKFLVPIDLETYRQLKNHIAKALVPLLQIWLFASHKGGAGSFEKRYDELCDFLTLQKYQAPSQILRQFKPSLDELTTHGYLEKWRIEQTADRKAYKIIFFHGPKFHRDRRRRGEQKIQATPTVVIGESEIVEPNLPEPGSLEPAPQPAAKHQTGGQGSEQTETEATSPTDIHSTLLDELSSRGVTPSVAIKLLQSMPADRLEQVADYIDYWDSIKRTSDVRPGLLLTFIKETAPLPANFETRQKRQIRQAAEDRRQKIGQVKDVLTTDYDEHRWATVETFIKEQIGTEEFERRVEARKKSMAKQGDLWDRMSPQRADTMARHEVRAEIAKGVNILSFEDFRRRELPRILATLKLDPADIGLEGLLKS